MMKAKLADIQSRVFAFNEAFPDALLSSKKLLKRKTEKRKFTDYV